MRRRIKPKNRLMVIVSLFAMFAITTTTIGYALFDKLLLLNGVVSIESSGKVEITKLELTESHNVTNHSESFKDLNVDISLSFDGTDTDYYAKYLVEITNASKMNFRFVNMDFGLVIQKEGTDGYFTYEFEGIENGDVILPSNTITFYVTVRLNVSESGAYDATGSGGLDVSYEDKGTILASMPNGVTGDLVQSDKVSITVSVINTYSYERDFSIASSNENFVIVDSNGNPITKLTIQAGQTQAYTFYIKLKDGYLFTSDTANTNVIFMCNGVQNINMGNVSLKVPVNVSTDDEAPVISNVTAVQNNTVGSVTVSFQATDASTITDFKIQVYKDNTLLKTLDTNSNVNYMEVTDLEAGSYYFVVYGVDEKGNTATQAQIESATTSSGAASKSETSSYKWVYNVETNLNNITFNGASTANIGTTYTGKFSVSGLYGYPTTIEVTMNGQALVSGTDYSYSKSNGNLSIPNVSGDIVITASARGCLIEGTKVLLADGTQKNIEDITYDDLLKVWDYEEGKYIYEYPVWIEKEKETIFYKEITFSDGTVLNVYGEHGVFNLDLNEFVSVTNSSKFKVGTTIAKIDNEGNIIPVKVTNIRMINKTAKYYHVVSNRYYNIIANNILTTDGEVMLSNLYGFKNNITWYLNRTQDIYSYDYFEDIMDYNMYTGLRVGEIKFLVDQNYISLDVFRGYLLMNQLNDDLYLRPSNNVKLTLDIDGIMTSNYYNKNDVVQLPIQKKNDNSFVCWYNTLDKKCYNNNISIIGNTYLKAIWK